MNRKLYLVLLIMLAAALLVANTVLAAPGDDDDDGVPNIDDMCPLDGDMGDGVDVVGCPFLPVDDDKDGFADYYESVFHWWKPGEDQCPGVPGPVDGCPYKKSVIADYDNDAMPDADDVCPFVAGHHDNNGCPWVMPGEQAAPPPSACVWDDTSAYLAADRVSAMGASYDEDVCVGTTLESAPDASVPGFTVIQAVSVPQGLPGTASLICFRGAGEIVLLPAGGGEPVWMETTLNGNDTCARVSTAGVLALVQPAE